MNGLEAYYARRQAEPSVFHASHNQKAHGARGTMHTYYYSGGSKPKVYQVPQGQGRKQPAGTRRISRRGALATKKDKGTAYLTNVSG